MSVHVTLGLGPGGPLAVKTATSPTEIDRLQREAVRLRKASHPGVVAIVGCEPVGQALELRTRYAGDAATRWSGSLARAAGLAAAIASTLADLHEIGMVHGRLDASHVLLGSDGRPRLCGMSGVDDATPADDVHALATLLDDLLSRVDVDRRSPLALTWPRGSAGDRRALTQVVSRALDPVASRRPSARALAASILGAVPGADLPPPSALPPVSGSAGGLSRWLAGATGTAPPPEPRQPPAPPSPIRPLVPTGPPLAPDDDPAAPPPLPADHDVLELPFAPDDDSAAVGAPTGDRPAHPATARAHEGAGGTAPHGADPAPGPDRVRNPASADVHEGASGGRLRSTDPTRGADRTGEPASADAAVRQHDAGDGLAGDDRTARRAADAARGRIGRTPWSAGSDETAPPYLRPARTPAWPDADRLDALGRAGSNQSGVDDGGSAGAARHRRRSSELDPTATRPSPLPRLGDTRLAGRPSIRPEGLRRPREAGRRRRTALRVGSACGVGLTLVAGGAVVTWGGATEGDNGVDPGAPSPAAASTPAACAGAPPPVADVDGDGCPGPVSVDGQVVEAEGIRWTLGEPGDLVAAGDWDCDGQASPVVVRPATGDVFVFPRWAPEGEPVVADAVASITPGAAEARSRSRADGCDELVVELATGEVTVDVESQP